MNRSRPILAALAWLGVGLTPALAQDVVVSSEVPRGGGSGGGGQSVNVVTMGPDDFDALGQAIGGALQAVADFLWPFEPAPAPPAPPPEAPMSTPPAGYNVDNSALFHEVPHAPGEQAGFQDDVLEGHDPNLPLRGNPHAGGTEFTGPPSGLDPTRPNDNREMRPAASQTAGDPVSLGDGELVLHQTDLSLSGPARPLRFERVYRSRSDERSVLGSNWTFNWDVWLRPLTLDSAPTWVPHRLLEGTTTKAVLLHDGVAGSLIFVTVGAAAPNDFVAMAGSAATLRRLDDSQGWELQDPDGRRRTFNKLGYLTEDRDRFGNGYRLEYEPTHLHTLFWRFFIGGHPLDEEEKPSVQVRYALGMCPARQWYHEDNYAFGASQVFWDFIRPNMWSSFRFSVQQNFVDDPFNKAAVGNLRTSILDNAASTLACQLAIVRVLDLMVGRRTFYRDLKRDFEFTDDRLVGRPRAMLEGLIADGLFTNADGTPKGNLQPAEETRLHNFYLAVLAEGLYDPHFQPIDEEPSHPLVEPAPGGTAPGYRAPLENEFHPVRFDDHAWFEESCRVLHSYLFEPDGTPVAWTRMALDGGHQLRPTKVVDDLGNELTFTYFPAATADEPNAGLLKQVSGPAGTKLTFEYTGPPYQPYQNHERLLRKAARIDAPPASTNITAAPEQNYVFDYQWQRGLMNKLPDLGWQVWDLYHRAGFPAAVPMTAYYLSQVSDNIIGVWRNVGVAPEIESETAYMVHPFSPVFDRVVRQRAGGSAVQAAGQNYGEFGVTMMTWQTGLPETRFDWGPESPSALLSFLPTQLKSRYPIEALPNSISSSLAPTPYFALPPSDEPEIRLRRSWLTDKQLGAASTYLGYDIHYRPNSNDYFLNDAGGEPIDWLAATRARTAADINRICRWAKVITGDGHQTIYGLNFRGETLVRAVRDGTQYVCFETTYDADGQPTTERKPDRTVQAWLPVRGGVRHAYLGVAGYSPAAWRSRLNLIRDTELPEGGPPTCFDGRGGQRKVAARHTRYFYEPVFNQPVEVRSLAEDVSGLQRIVYTVRYEYDCGPGATATAKAVRAERGQAVAVTERLALDDDIRALEQLLAELRSSKARAELEQFAAKRRQTLLDLARRHDDKVLRAKLGEADAVLLAQAAGGRGRLFDRDLVLVRTRLQEALDRLRGLRPILPGIDQGDGQPAGANSCGRPRPDRLILENPAHPDTRRVIELGWSSLGRLVQWSEQGGEQMLYTYYQGRGVNGDEARNAAGRGPLAEVTRPQYDLDYPLTDGPPDAPNAELRGPYQWLLPAGTPAASLVQLGLPARVSDAIRATANAQSAVQASHLQYRYNLLGEEVRTTRDGAVTLTECDSLGRPLRRTDPEGLVWTYTYDTAGRPADLSARDGNQILRSRTQWQYDSDGRITRLKRFRVEGDVVGMTDQYSYNPVGLAASHTDPTGLVTTFTYDALDQLSRADTQAGGTGPILQQIRYSSDDDGSLRRVHYGTDAVRSADGQVSEHYEYDGFGRLSRAGTQRGRKLLLRHSERDELTEQLWEFTKEEDQRAAKDRGDDGYASHERFAYDDHGRRVTAQRDGLLLETLVYTPAGRLVSHQVAGGGSRFATCDRGGNEVWSREPDGSQRASLWDPVQRRRFDLAIRPNPDGGSPVTTCLETQFDRELRPLRQIAYGDGEPRETTLSRNGAGDVSATLYPDGSVRHAAYDLLGRLELDLVQMHAGDLSAFEPTHFHRDAAGRITLVTDPSGQDIVYTYDPLGRLISERCPGFGQPTRWEYDGHGRVKRRVLPDGAAIRFAYDSRGDLTGETLEGAGGGLLTQRRYDEQGRLIDLLETNRALAALGIPTAEVKQQFAYDLLDRPTLQRVAVGNLPGHEVGATWELQDGGASWQRQISYPTGASWLTRYDAAGRLVRLERTEGPPAQVDFLYAGDRYAGRDQVFQPSADPLRERRRFNGFGEPVRWSYTALDRAADGSPLHAAWAEQYAGGGALPAGPLAELTVARDEMGRTAAVATACDHPGLPAGGRRPWRGYGYGPHARLTTLLEADGVPDGFEPGTTLPGAGAAAALAGQAGIAAVPFEYVREPLVGGTLGVATIAAGQSRWEAVPRGPGHRLREVHLGGQAVTVVHDAAGRVSSEALGGYVWDARGRLIARKAANGAMLEAYAYDGYGRLTAVFQPGGKVQSFVYDGEQIIAAYDAGGTALWDAAWGVDRDHLIEWRDLKTNRVFIPLADERNGIAGVWSAADGRLIETAEYDPDGRASRFDSGGGLTSRDGGPDLADGLKCGLPFGFGTAFSPPRSGLVYLRNRWYSTRLCQFLSPDPLGYTDSANPYAYAAFDPINRADPLGLESGGFDAGHALHEAGRLVEGKALDALSNEPGERPSVPLSVFSYLRKGRGGFLRSEAARVAGARAAGEQAVTGMRNTVAWNALRRGGAAEASRMANVLARTPEKMNILEFAWAGAKARLFGSTGTAAETAARGLAQAISKAPAYSIPPSRMASIVSAVGTPSTASQVFGILGRAAAPAEAVIRIGWRALTDDPARAGQFHGEPLFHPYARWEREEMVDWYAKQNGLPEHDDPYWQQQVAGDPYPSFNAP